MCIEEHDSRLGMHLIMITVQLDRHETKHTIFVKEQALYRYECRALLSNEVRENAWDRDEFHVV